MLCILHNSLRTVDCFDVFFFFSSRRRHTRSDRDWSSDVCSSDLAGHAHDFDDTNFALMGHPSVPLLAAALAAGEAETPDRPALTPAYIVGFQGGPAP